MKESGTVAPSVAVRPSCLPKTPRARFRPKNFRHRVSAPHVDPDRRPTSDVPKTIVCGRVLASLQSLTREELRLDTEPVTIDPQPKRVRAWVRFGGTPTAVEALACRWTSDAVAIEFEISGKQLRTWVWASAVTPLPRQ